MNDYGLLEYGIDCIEWSDCLTACETKSGSAIKGLVWFIFAMTLVVLWLSWFLKTERKKRVEAEKSCTLLREKLWGKNAEDYKSGKEEAE